MKTIIVILNIILSLNYCISDNKSANKVITRKNVINRSWNSNKYQKIHSFIDKNNEVFADLYGKKLNDTVYTSFIIKSLLEEYPDTLYEIKGVIFKNKYGEDLKLNDVGFFGYKIQILGNHYLDLLYLQNLGNNVSDPIKIYWNERILQFEVLRIP
ncbi:MAG: hypothetical protein R6X28_05565 [Bacteroidales bacterium]